MTIDYTSAPGIPGLAWFMRVRDGRAEVTHGSRVETTSWFFTDGIWAGAFGEGRFDQSFFCGTGVIDSRSGLTIVSASTPLDRVFTTTMGPELFASNSLPFFLAMIDDSLDEDWLFYRSQFIAAKTGFRIARRQFSTRRGRRVRVVTGETAVVGQGGELIPRLRPLDSDFADFGHYRSTLAATVAALVANSRCLERRLPLEPLVSLSAGYDSTAVAVLVSEAGGKHAATMLRYGEDGELVDHPGMATARLGLRLKEFERDTWRDRTDLPDAEIAAAGTEFIDIPFLALEEELPGKVLVRYFDPLGEQVGHGNELGVPVGHGQGVGCRSRSTAAAANQGQADRIVFGGVDVRNGHPGQDRAGGQRSARLHETAAR